MTNYSLERARGLYSDGLNAANNVGSYIKNQAGKTIGILGLVASPLLMSGQDTSTIQNSSQDDVSDTYTFDTDGQNEIISDAFSSNALASMQKDNLSDVLVEDADLMQPLSAMKQKEIFAQVNRVQKVINKIMSEEEEHFGVGDGDVQSKGGIYLEYWTMKNRLKYESIPELESLYELINDAIELQGGTPFEDFDEFLEEFLHPKKRFHLLSLKLNLDWSLSENIPVQIVTSAGLSPFTRKKGFVSAGLKYEKMFDIDDLSRLGFSLGLNITYDFALRKSDFLIRSFDLDDEPDRKENLEILFEDIKVFSPLYANVDLLVKYKLALGEQGDVEVYVGYKQFLGDSSVGAEWTGFTAGFGVSF